MGIALDTLLIAGGKLGFMPRRKTRRLVDVGAGARRTGAPGGVGVYRGVPAGARPGCWMGGERRRIGPHCADSGTAGFRRSGWNRTRSSCSDGHGMDFGRRHGGNRSGAWRWSKRIWGAPSRSTVARHLVVFLKRPGGQAQFSATLSLQGSEDRFGALHTWIGTQLDGDLSLPRLADQAGMSERSFSRHYAEATGMTPGRGVERLRVEAARQMLAESPWPIKRIARRCGFGSEETMRRSFLRLIATTPQDYRARFSD